MKKRIDERFDQFSANELSNADPKALTFGLAWVPPLTAEERDFVRSYSRSKLASIREQLQAEEPAARPVPKAD